MTRSLKRTRFSLKRGKALVIALVVVLFASSVAFLLFRLDVISIGEKPADWAIPEPDISATELRVQELLSRSWSAVKNDPANPGAWGQYAMALDAHLLTNSAVEAYWRAHLLAPDDFKWAYLYAATRALQSAPPEEVTELLKKAIALRPDYAPGYVRMGDILISAGKTPEAKKAYEKAIELDGQIAVARRSLGQILLTMGKVDEAVRHLEQADRLIPDDRAVASALAQGYMRQGDERRADRYASLAAEAIPQIGLIDPVRREVEELGVSTRLCDERAQRRMSEGLYGEAIDDLLIVLQKYPDDATVPFRIGVCYDEIEDPNQAVLFLTGAIRLQDDLVEAHLRLAKIFWNRDFRRVAGHYRKVIEYSPPSAELHTTLGVALARSDDIDGAIVEFRRAIELDPDEPKRHSDLCNALVITGDYEGALESCTRAVELDPRQASANYNLGMISEQQGHIEEAITFYRRALQVNPASPAAGRLVELTTKSDDGE